MRFSSLSSLLPLLVSLAAAVPSPGANPDLVSGFSPNKRVVSFNALLATRGISVRDNDDVDYIVVCSLSSAPVSSLKHAGTGTF